MSKRRKDRGGEKGVLPDFALRIQLGITFPLAVVLGTFSTALVVVVVVGASDGGGIGRSPTAARISGIRGGVEESVFSRG